MAAELHDLVYEDLWRMYPEAVGELTITLIEGQDILGAFDQKLREHAKRQFARQRIRLKTGAFVTRVTNSHIILSTGEQVEHGLVVWATGIAPRKFVGSLDRQRWAKDGWGHLVTDQYMRALGSDQGSDQGQGQGHGSDHSGAGYGLATLPGVFAIGDCCAVQGRRLAATAQVAEQQGNYVGELLNDAAGRSRTKGLGDPLGMLERGLQPPIGDVVVGHRALEGDSDSESDKTKSSARGEGMKKFGGGSTRPEDALTGAGAGSGAGTEGHVGLWEGLRPFEYQHAGSLAYIGSWGALADLRDAIDPKVSAVKAINLAATAVTGGDSKTIAGWAAWVVWRSAYLTKLGAWRNRAQVPADWLRTFLFGRDVSQF